MINARIITEDLYFYFIAHRLASYNRKQTNIGFYGSISAVLDKMVKSNKLPYGIPVKGVLKESYPYYSTMKGLVNYAVDAKRAQSKKENSHYE